MTKVAALDEREAELERLRRSMNDLVSALALTSMWSGAAAPEIGRTLVEALANLLNLDVAYVRLNPVGAPTTTNHAVTSPDLGLSRSKLDARITVMIEANPGAPSQWRIGKLDVCVVVTPLGIGGEAGVLVVASRIPGFPNDHELLLLRVCANQAASALQEARRLDEQKRRAIDLDRHVDQQTAELRTANAALQREVIERSRAEQALRESETRLRAVIDGIPGFVAILAADGDVEAVNPQIISYCGQSLEDLKRWGENGTVHPDDLAHVASIFGPSIAAGTPYVIQQRLRRHDGEYRWFDNRGVPVRDESGRVVQWYVLLTDIDDHHRVEQALSESEQIFRQTFNAIPTLAWCNRIDGSNEFLNQRWHDYTGLTPEEANGWGWQIALHPDDLPHLLVKWTHMLATGESGEIEARLRRHDGIYRWFLFRCDPLRDANGAIVKWYGTNTDIDDLKRAERALAESERDLQLNIDSIPTLTWAALPDGTGEFFNKSYLDYVGLPTSELQGWRWKAVIHPDDLPTVERAWESFSAAQAGGEVEARIRRYDGEYRWFLFRTNPLRGRNGEIIKWYGANTDIEDRKRADAARIESERENRQIAHSIAGMVAVFSPDGVLNGGNQRLLDYFQLPLEEIGKWATNGITHPDDLEHCISSFSASIASGAPYDFQTRFRRFDGQYRWFQVRGLPLRDGQGRITRWYGLLLDIEDQKRAESILAGESELLGMIAAGQPLGAVLRRLALLAERALPGFVCEICTADITGSRLAHCHAPSLPPLYTIASEDCIIDQDASPRARAARARMQITVQDIAQDGSWRTDPIQQMLLGQGLRSAWSTPIVSNDGRLLGTLSLFSDHASTRRPDQEDVTARAARIASIALERHWAEDTLIRNDYIIAEAERISGTGSYWWDLTTNKLVWSKGMYRFWEVEEGLDPTQQDLMAKVHPDDKALVQEKVERCFRGEGSPENEERLIMPDGRIKHMWTSFRVARREDGHIESVGVMQDITQRRQSEDALNALRAELAHASRVMSLGELAASIAHEVNQPLSGIVTNANTCLRMLSADPPNIAGALETAERSIRDGNRASEVLRRLRGLFRKQGFTPEALDINDTIQEVVATFAHDLRRRRISLKVVLEPALAPVAGDRIEIQQVVLNLVLNAADAIENTDHEPRQITLESRADTQGCVRVVVRDTGCGIPTEFHNRIFDAFYTTKPNGMGIGLSVSKSIIERHKGELWASANEGPGTTIGFSVPYAQTTGGPSQNLNAEPPQEQGT